MNPIKVYVSAHAIQDAKAVAANLKDKGYEVVSRWHNGCYDDGEKKERADRNFADIDRADVVVSVVSAELVPGGKHVEAGYAKGKGKPVFLFSYGATPAPENLALHGEGFKTIAKLAEIAHTVNPSSGHGC